jgi:hypothetical protein
MEEGVGGEYQKRALVFWVKMAFHYIHVVKAHQQVVVVKGLAGATHLPESNN